MKLYQSIPLAIASLALIGFGGCKKNDEEYNREVMLKGEIVYEKGQIMDYECGKGYQGKESYFDKDYTINLKDDGGMISNVVLTGDACLLSSLEKSVEPGDGKKVEIVGIENPIRFGERIKMISYSVQ